MSACQCPYLCFIDHNCSIVVVLLGWMNKVCIFPISNVNYSIIILKSGSFYLSEGNMKTGS